MLSRTHPSRKYTPMIVRITIIGEIGNPPTQSDNAAGNPAMLMKFENTNPPISTLNSTAVVEGDIYHRSLAIEENAQFEGLSRRQENVIDMPSLVPAKLPQAQAVSINVPEQGNGAADGLNPSLDHRRQSPQAGLSATPESGHS